MSRQLLAVEADTNDGDYVTRLTEGSFNLTVIKKVAKAIKGCKTHPNWGTGEMCSDDESPEVLYEGKLTEEEIEEFRGYCPSGEHGVHSIESITMYEVTSRKKIL